MEVCKHCGTSENLIISTKTGKPWCVCKECKGEQTRKQFKGIPKTIDHKNKITDALIGRILPEDVRLKISESTKGRIPHNLGKPQSAETCKKIGDSNRGKSPTPDTRKKLSDATKGIPKSEETKFNMSKTQTYSVSDYQEKYPWFFLFEEMRDVPFELGKPSVEVHCKKCNNWFRPALNIITKRIVSLQKNKDNQYFYCSDECKHSCPLFRLNSIHYINNLNRPDNEPIRTTPEYQTFRKEVFHRQLISEDIEINHCEICNSEQNLHIHHEHPIKTHPHLALDPDNGIILCKECHYEYGHIDECSTGHLANQICTDTIQIGE